jgi:hypothetical protein
MMMLLTALAVQLAASTVQPGVADVRRDGRLCIALPGSPPRTGSPVTLVQIAPPQSATVVSIAEPVDTCETLTRAGFAGPYYLAMPPSTEAFETGLWLAIRGRPSTRVKAGVVTLDLGPAGRTAQTRSCTSSEGLHLTLWAGMPLKSTRLWHGYYYLGYDVEPTCDERDYAP